jgi:hypothetical protein
MVIFILFHTFVILWWFFNEFPFQMFLYVRHATRVTIGNYFLNFTLNNNSQLFFNIFNWSSCLCWLFFYPSSSFQWEKENLIKDKISSDCCDVIGNKYARLRVCVKYCI